MFSAEADRLYRRLGGLGPWAAVPVDEDAWRLARGRLNELRAVAPGWLAMVDRGCLLAAAHEAGAADNQHDADPDLRRALIDGTLGFEAVDPDARAHVRANYEALGLARNASATGLATEEAVRRLHAVACAPQATHPVRTAAGHQDHVLAHGDYKHHANHVLDDAGTWHPRAPVELLAAEMGLFISVLGSPEFTALHAVNQAAFVLDGLGHIGPFADGNGRVARALAGAHLLRAAGIPLVTCDGGDHGTDPAATARAVQQGCLDLVEHIDHLHSRAGSSATQSVGYRRWQRGDEAANVLRAVVPGAARQALERHHRRPAVSWQSGLADAALTADGIGVPVGVGPPVVEVLAVDPHPLTAEPGSLVIRAERGGLHLEVAVDEIVPRLSAGVEAQLSAWLDRVTMALA
ncbi:MAG: Fic family protein, partial [Acidimicrobiales bacterium]